jgi:hypothetical protein
LGFGRNAPANGPVCPFPEFFLNPALVGAVHWSTRQLAPPNASNTEISWRSGDNAGCSAGKWIGASASRRNPAPFQGDRHNSDPNWPHLQAMIRHAGACVEGSV